MGSSHQKRRSHDITIRYYKTSNTEGITGVKIVFKDNVPQSVELNPGTKFWGPYPLAVAHNSTNTMVSAQHYYMDRAGEVFSAFLYDNRNQLTGLFVNYAVGRRPIEIDAALDHADYTIAQGNDAFDPDTLDVMQNDTIQFTKHSTRTTFGSFSPPAGLFTDGNSIKENHKRTVSPASGTFKINTAKEPREGGPEDGMEGTIKVGTGGHNHPDKGHGHG